MLASVLDQMCIWLSVFGYIFTVYVHVQPSPISFVYMIYNGEKGYFWSSIFVCECVVSIPVFITSPLALADRWFLFGSLLSLEPCLPRLMHIIAPYGFELLCHRAKEKLQGSHSCLRKLYSIYTLTLLIVKQACKSRRAEDAYISDLYVWIKSKYNMINHLFVFVFQYWLHCTIHLVNKLLCTCQYMPTMTL